MLQTQAKRIVAITPADWALLAVAMIWGSSYSAVKYVLSFSDVVLFIFVRFSLTAMFMLPIFITASKGRIKETIKVGSILGVLLFLIFWCETAGVQRTLAVNAAFFISLCVLFTPLIESVIARSWPKPSLLLACALSCVGAGMMGLKVGYHFDLSSGDIIIIGAAILRAVGVVATKRLMHGKHLDSGAVTFIQMLMVAVISGAWLLGSGHEEHIPRQMSFWMVTLYLVIFCTLIAFYTQTHMIRLTSPTRVILIMGTEPLFGALFAVLLLNESLWSIQLAGGILIVFATYLGIKTQGT